MFEEKGGVFIRHFFNCCGAEMNQLNQRSNLHVLIPFEMPITSVESVVGSVV